MNDFFIFQFFEKCKGDEVDKLNKISVMRKNS